MNEHVKVMGVIGEGISHSLSPKIHNHAIKSLGIDAVYQTFDVKNAELEALFSEMWEKNALGFNVTMPHKQAVARMFSYENLSSVNTVYRGESGWLATSTDAAGLENALERFGCKLSGFKKIVFIGNGGATLAIIEHLTRRFSKQPKLVVLRRSAWRDEAILAAISNTILWPRFETLDCQHLENELCDRDGSTLLIQGSSAPLRGEMLHYLTPALERFRGVFVDLVYAQPSALYQAAKSHGLVAIDGLPMLIEQARLSQRYWWKKAVDYAQLYSLLSS